MSMTRRDFELIASAIASARADGFGGKNVGAVIRYISDKLYAKYPNFKRRAFINACKPPDANAEVTLPPATPTTVAETAQPTGRRRFERGDRVEHTDGRIGTIDYANDSCANVHFNGDEAMAIGVGVSELRPISAVATEAPQAQPIQGRRYRLLAPYQGHGTGEIATAGEDYGSDGCWNWIFEDGDNTVAHQRRFALIPEDPPTQRFRVGQRVRMVGDAVGCCNRTEGVVESIDPAEARPISVSFACHNVRRYRLDQVEAI